MTAATAVAVLPTRRPTLAWGLSAFVWLLPLHALVITVLFGALGWSAPVVRAVAAWKELLIALLFGLAVIRTVGSPRPRAEIYWPDLVVAGLGILALGYSVGESVWFGSGLPLEAQLYALRDAAFVSLLYFVGRASPEVGDSPRLLRALFLVGVVTSAIAVLERILVTPEILVLLGAARYVQDFLGAAAITAGNAYGLPDNYWTLVGSHSVQRAGSTYMSGQGFAVPFLIVLPAATLWLLSASGRRAPAAWLGYALLWIGLLLTVTRMTIAVCALESLIIMAAHRRWGSTVGLGLVTLAGFGAALLFVPGLATFVWETVTWQSPSSEWHVADWTAGLDQVMRNPLGVGLGATDFVAARFGVQGLTGDNQYLKYAVEMGVLGVLLHVGVLAAALVTGVRAWRNAPDAPAGAAGLLLVATTVGIALNAMTAVVFNSPMLSYLFFWLAGSVTTVAYRREATGP
jgi:O-antigen ligase/polysaccharide polymerase Wzy-like membrane protein